MTKRTGNHAGAFFLWSLRAARSHPFQIEEPECFVASVHKDARKHADGSSSFL
jgi:hypothetical protein